jgi:hypothetical protein
MLQDLVQLFAILSMVALGGPSDGEGAHIWQGLGPAILAPVLGILKF